MKKIILSLTLPVFMSLFTGMLDGTLGAQEIIGVESRIVESWDGPDASYFNDTGEPVSWEVRGSKYTAENRPRLTYAMKVWPVELLGIEPEEPDKLGVLGINGGFTRQGYNQIELIPGVKNGEEFIQKDLPLPGQVQMLNFWVWGGYYDYYVEFHLRDRKGIIHVINPVVQERSNVLGSIQFVGWKNMHVYLPSSLRVPDPALGLDGYSLLLSKIVFTSRPKTSVSNFYVYLDQISVISYLRRDYYDGIRLTAKKTIDEIWGTGE